jgi:hypothetical protein
MRLRSPLTTLRLWQVAAAAIAGGSNPPIRTRACADP